jgi:hypothetical protein
MIIGRIAALLVVAAALPVACRSKPMPPAASTAGSAGSSTATPEARREAYAAAVKALSKQVNAPKDSIVGVSQDETTWNDACLGCAGSGEKCAQVLTPGYRVLLRVSGATYEYHTDLGGKARLCSQSLPPTPTAVAAPAPAPLAEPTPEPTPGLARSFSGGKAT